VKLSNNFYLQEFVSKYIYQKYKDNATWYVDDRLIDLAQFIRDRYKKPVIINTWHYSIEGAYQYRGHRPMNCKIGAKRSQHKYGRAFDFTVDMPLTEVFSDIILNKEKFMKKGLTAIESIEKSRTWIHVDVRHIPNKTDLLIF
jgi:uncharacterized protein YcbK (DUF882 family)